MIQGYQNSQSDYGCTYPGRAPSPFQNDNYPGNWGYNTWAQQQQRQQATQQKTSVNPQIFCKFVDSEQDISPRDVPTDGSICAFVQSDLKKVYLKTWNFDGYQGNTYVLDQPDQNQEPQPDPFAMIMDRLTAIEEAVKGGKATAKPAQNPKKEIKEDA